MIYAKIPTHYLPLPKIPLSFEDTVSLSSRFLSVSHPFSPVLARSRPSSPVSLFFFFVFSVAVNHPMAPKRAKVLAKKSTNPKKAKVVHDVPQKQPPTTTTTTTTSTPVKETSVSAKASEAPPSIQPPSVQLVVPPTKPVSLLNFFFKYIGLKIQFLPIKFGFLVVEVSHWYW